MLNALSFDLEDWHPGDGIVHTTDLLLNNLGTVKTTFFILGSVAEQHPKLVKAIHQAGHEIGVHGYAHRLVYEQTPSEFKEDLRRVISIVEDIIGDRVIGHRAPWFSITEKSLWALPILSEEGLKYDSSVFPTKTTLYGIPDSPRFAHQVSGLPGPFWEIPLTTVRLLGINVPCAGGFYARAQPYSFLRWAIRRVNEEGYPAVLYFHPWELAGYLPKLSMTLRDRLVRSYNIGSTIKKFRRLLQDFAFASLQEVFNI